MAKTSGNTIAKTSSKGTGIRTKDADIYDVNSVSNTLQQYAKVDRWNNNTAYNLGFNDQAQAVIDDVAALDNGLASDIAKTVKERNYNISEKQAYHIAKAAVDHNIISSRGSSNTLFSSDTKVAIANRKRKEILKASQKEAQRSAYKSTFKRSTTKIESGQSISGKYGNGVITKVITKSTGYVEVKYANGVIRKEMAFNLKGKDGNPLKMRPK